ncbi:MAG: hypothetical protein HOM96_00795 [Rickettsiales bacterium]|nr:hypothetical protein [Rickettsiales bacterium]
MTGKNSETLNDKMSKLEELGLEDIDNKADQIEFILHENELIKQLYSDLEKAEMMLEESNDILTEQVKNLSHDLSDSEIQLIKNKSILENAFKELQNAKESSQNDSELSKEYKESIDILTINCDELTELVEKVKLDNEEKTSELEKLKSSLDKLIKELEDKKAQIVKLKQTYVSNLTEVKKKHELDNQELNNQLSETKNNLMQSEINLEKLNDKLAKLEKDYELSDKNNKNQQKLISKLEQDINDAFQEKFDSKDKIYNLETELQNNEIKSNKAIKDLEQSHHYKILEKQDVYTSKVSDLEMRVDELHEALDSAKEINKVINDKLAISEDQKVRSSEELNQYKEKSVIFEDDNKLLAQSLKDKELNIEDLQSEQNHLKLEHQANYEEIKTKFNESQQRILILESLNKELKHKLDNNKNLSRSEQARLKIVINDQTNEQKNLDKENYRLLGELDEIKAQYKVESKKQYENYQNQVMEIKDSHDNIKINMQVKYDELCSNFTALRQSEERLDGKLFKQDNIIASFEKKMNAKMLEIERLEQEKSALQNELMQGQMRDADFKLEIHDLNSKLDDHQEDHYDVKQSNAKLQEEIEIHKHDINNLNMQMEQDRKNHHETKESNNQLNKEIEHHKQDIIELRAQMDSDRKRYHKNRTLTDKLKLDLDHHTREIERVRLNAAAMGDKEKETINMPKEIELAFKELRKAHKLKVSILMVAYESTIRALQDEGSDVNKTEDAMKTLTINNAAELVMLEEDFINSERNLSDKLKNIT